MNRFLPALLFFALCSFAPASAQQWVEYKPQGAGFRVEFPGAPDIETEDLSSSELGPMQMTTAEHITPNEAVLMAAYASLPPEALGADPKVVLDGFPDGMVREAKCKLRRESQVRVGGAPARRILMDCSDGDLVSVGLLMMSGHRLYATMAAVPRGREEGPTAQRFLKSFALVPR